MDLIKVSENGLVIIGFITASGSIIYWIIQAKIAETFVKKELYKENCDRHIKNCDSKHFVINEHVDSVRAEIKEDIREIKSMILTMQGWIMELLQDKKVNK